MAYNGDGNFWYILNNDTKIAQISYMGPLGGGEASFITYENEDDARLCFFNTSRASSGNVLKPITFTYDKNMKAWIVFYPVYTDFLNWWNAKRKYDVVCLSLVKNARKILKCLIETHKEGVAHGELQENSNYVIVCVQILKCLIETHKEGVAHGELQENSNYVIVGNAQPMLINFKLCRDKETNQEWRAICLDDIETFLDKLLEYLPTNRVADHDIIVSHLNFMKTKADCTSDKLLLYPYWKSAYKRMMVFFYVDNVMYGDISLLYDLHYQAVIKNVVTLPWDT